MVSLTLFCVVTVETPATFFGVWMNHSENLPIKDRLNSPLCKYWMLNLFLSSVRCSNLELHRRPSPSAQDCWNTRRWRGCLPWRHVHMPSSMSFANPTPVSPADENCRSSSTSVLLVSLRSLCFCFIFLQPVLCDCHALTFVCCIILTFVCLLCRLRAVYPAPVELHTHSSSRSRAVITCLTWYVCITAFFWQSVLSFTNL